MKNKKFWNFKEPEDLEERILYLNETISEKSWFEDDVTPEMFREELFASDRDIVVWINSPGGDVIAGAQIYNVLLEYPDHVTVKIDGIAASAASVIAMIGDTIYMSPVSMMIHNPMTVAIGDHVEMEKAKEMLASFKESIINAYEKKTGLSRQRLSELMDAETWMDVGKAMELDFCDSVLTASPRLEFEETQPTMLFSRKAVTI